MAFWIKQFFTGFNNSQKVSNNKYVLVILSGLTVINYTKIITTYLFIYACIIHKQNKYFLVNYYPP